MVQIQRWLQNKENRPIYTYKLTNIIRNKILSYKDTVNLIYCEDEISFTFNTDSYECEHSPFIDRRHKEIITGYLRIAGNSRLRTLFTKCPTYREPRSTNFIEAFVEITTGLDNCIENLVNKTQYNVNNFDQRKKIISEKINLEKEKFKRRIKPSFTKPTLFDTAVLAYLEILYWKYVIVLIDKASNNFKFISKKFCISKILSGVGEYNNILYNSSYSKSNFSEDDIINNNENYCQNVDPNLTRNDSSLLIMYWFPRISITSTGARFITASKNCSTKLLSGVISKIFKTLLKHVKYFHYKKF